MINFSLILILFIGTQVGGGIRISVEQDQSIVYQRDSVVIQITLTNTSAETRRILFDKPAISTGGPWGTTASVIDVSTGRSVLKFENKAILSSQIYSTQELQDKHRTLAPGESISKNYNLDDIVVVNSDDGNLRAGTYTVQLFYTDQGLRGVSASNILKLTVR